jgi:hypothetical protein
MHAGSILNAGVNLEWAVSNLGSSSINGENVLLTSMFLQMFWLNCGYSQLCKVPLKT